MLIRTGYVRTIILCVVVMAVIFALRWQTPHTLLATYRVGYGWQELYELHEPFVPAYVLDGDAVAFVHDDQLEVFDRRGHHRSVNLARRRTRMVSDFPWVPVTDGGRYMLRQFALAQTLPFSIRPGVDEKIARLAHRVILLNVPDDYIATNTIAIDHWRNDHKYTLG